MKSPKPTHPNNLLPYSLAITGILGALPALGQTFVDFRQADYNLVNTVAGQDLLFTRPDGSTGSVNMRVEGAPRAGQVFFTDAVNYRWYSTVNDPTRIPYTFVFTFAQPETFILKQDEAFYGNEYEQWTTSGTPWELVETGYDIVVDGVGTNTLNLSYDGAHGSVVPGEYGMGVAYSSTAQSFTYIYSNDTPGYTGDLLMIVPEPSGVLLSGLAGGLLMLRRRRMA